MRQQQPYTGEERRARPRGFRFDNTINLGHILTFAGFVVTIVIGWSTMDKRVVVLEESRKAQEARDINQDARASDQLATIRDSLTEIKRSVEKLGDKLEKRR